MKLYHFYHIYADGKWGIPVWQHLWAIKKSGLSAHLENFFIGIAGSNENRKKVEDFLKVYSRMTGLKYQIVSQEDEGWEQVTLDKLYEFSQDHEGFVLYAHTKGAANRMKPNPGWRRTMTHFNIYQWKRAVEKLKDHQAVGCFWLLPEDLPINGYYFGGNFWWSHLSLVRTLGKPSRSCRFQAEVWIGKNFKAKPFPVFDLYPVFPNVAMPKKGIAKFLDRLANRIKTRLKASLEAK